MKERLAIIDGIRTPMGKAGSSLKKVKADDLGAYALSELMARSSLDFTQIDEVILGNVAQPSHAANIARVVALKAGFPISTSAFTVHRNCASGMESITTAFNRIIAGEATIIVAGGTESMSNVPLLVGPQMTSLFEQLQKAKTSIQKLKVLLSFRLSFLKPIVGIVEGLTDPVCGLIMGLTAENLAKEFRISREEQDKYALFSHQKASKAQASGVFKQEIVPIPTGPGSEHLHFQDEGPRANQTIEALEKLKPYFDRVNGTVTVGNACPLTDGAAGVIVMSESKAKALQLKPLGYLRSYAYAGLDPARMGLGPVYATSKVLDKTGLQLSDFDRIEINEAFAVQVLACLKAFESDSFSQHYLNKPKALGVVDPAIVNVNGGAIALGHPVGMTGTRIILTLLHELRRSGLKRGLATLCVGGGQGGACVVEVDE